MGLNGKMVERENLMRGLGHGGAAPAPPAGLPQAPAVKPQQADRFFMAPGQQNLQFGMQKPEPLELNAAFQLKREKAQLGFDKGKEAKEVLRDGVIRLEELAKQKDMKNEEKVPPLQQVEERDKGALLQDQEMRGRAGGMARRE